jgi:hypothetical protein
MKTLLTLQQLSDETGIPVATLYTKCAPSGDLPVVRMTEGPSTKRRTRGRIYIRREDWDAYVLRHRTARDEQAIERVRPRADIRDLPGASRYIQ